jgi:hypothetical protein
VITEHTICALPADHPEWRHYAIKVQRRNNGDWVLNLGGEYLSSNPNAEAGWYPGLADAINHSEEEALALAEELAPHVECNGFTVDDVLARYAR